MHNDPLVVSLRAPKPVIEEEVKLPAQTPAPPPAPPRIPRSQRRNPSRFMLIALVVCVILGSALWFAWKNGALPWGEKSESESAQKADDTATNEDANDLIARVGELIVLPEGEEPTVATVTDPAKLKEQVFFANAKTGDKVLIYTKARKAYLYDPDAHKLIEVAPLTVDAQ